MTQFNARSGAPCTAPRDAYAQEEGPNTRGLTNDFIEGVSNALHNNYSPQPALASAQRARSVNLVLAAVIGGRRLDAAANHCATNVAPRSLHCAGACKIATPCATTTHAETAEIAEPAPPSLRTSRRIQSSLAGNPLCFIGRLECAWSLQAWDCDDGIRGTPRSFPCLRITREDKCDGQGRTPSKQCNRV
jgi:hypothetical protein